MNMIFSCHPAVSLLLFISVIGFTMFSVNPILLTIAFFGGILFFITYGKGYISKKEIFGFVLMFIFVAITNPLFVHRGQTVLFFLNDNPITMEALLYGVNISIMLMSVIFWFKCFNFVITEDKILYLFGKISPKVALVISSSLKFIPTAKRKANEIKTAQKTMGLYSTDTVINKLKSSVNVYSSLISWGFENAVLVGSSMKCRCYGENKPTFYEKYNWKISDTIFIIQILLMDVAVICSMAMGNLDFKFYPYIKCNNLNVFGIFGIICFTVLCFLPCVLQIQEEIKWKYYKSKI